MNNWLQNMNFREKDIQALLINFIVFHNFVGQDYGKAPLSNSSDPYGIE